MKKTKQAVAARNKPGKEVDASTTPGSVGRGSSTAREAGEKKAREKERGRDVYLQESLSHSANTRTMAHEALLIHFMGHPGKSWPLVTRFVAGLFGVFDFSPLPFSVGGRT